MEKSNNGIIEIRTYNLKPNTGGEFDRIITEQSVPMLKRWNVNVIAFGNSLDNKDNYFLIRSYQNLEERKGSQDAFYASNEWVSGPRESIISLIQNYTEVVIYVNDEIKKICSNVIQPKL